ncbi:MAG: hypothetical protein GSR81_01920 [Desulfurococcales archaeon]|nr:hypothetical protein [Desulfurococcales archaeon]
MSVEGMLSKCPKLVMVAKEGREYWALEELYDVLAVVDNYEVSKVARGVFAVYTGSSIEILLDIVRSYEYSFIRHLFFIDECVSCSGLGDNLRSYMERRCDSPLRVKFRLKLRSGCRETIGRSKVEEIIRSSGCIASRRGSYMLVIESVSSNSVGLVFGCIRSCNYGCQLVIPLSVCEG